MHTARLLSIYIYIFNKKTKNAARGILKCRASPFNICADEKKEGLNSFPCNAWLSPHPVPLHLNAYNLGGAKRIKSSSCTGRSNHPLLQILIHWTLGRVSTKSHGASSSPMQRIWPCCDPAMSSELHITELFSSLSIHLKSKD